MTRLREDPDLVLPEPPATIPVLGPEHAGPAVASPAGPHALLIEGDRTTVVGSQRGRVERVLIDGRLVAEKIETDIAATANVVTWPGLIRRERVGPNGPCLETILAAPTIPLIAIQWSTTGSALPESVSIRLPIRGDSVRYRAGPRSTALVDGAGDMIAIGMSPTPESVEVVQDSQSAVHVRIQPTAGGSVTLLIAAGPPPAVATAFAAAAHLPAHARLAREAPLDDGLTLSTGVAEVDDAVHWARRRLRSALSGASPGTGQSPLWAAIAAVGVADRAGADLGYRLARAESETLAAVIAGAIATTFGDTRPARDSTERLLGMGPLSPAEDASDRALGRTLRRAALLSLSEALHNAAPDTLISSLRAAATERGDRDDVGGGSRGAASLPMVGRTPQVPDLGGWLPTLLSGEPTSPAPTGRSEGEGAICALPALFRVDPDAAWKAWRATVAHGLAAGPAGPGSWDAHPMDGDLVAPGTSSLLIALAYGLLGLCPDAHAGRIRLAPRLPSHLTSFTAKGVTVGRARLTLSYERDGDAHRYVLEPTGGAVPPRAVFEPAVPGVVRHVRIDGVSADLETRVSEGRTYVPVQLPVDGIRSVEILTG